MWRRDYGQRLQQWYHLRCRCAAASLDACLGAINSWWFEYPWTAYVLHWDDYKSWPDPWQLLEEPRVCSLARGLGMLYTIAMLDREDLQDAALIETTTDNLVRVQGQKYILNWYPDTIVNINPGARSRHCWNLIQARAKTH